MKTRYRVTATFVFENIEADNEEWAQEIVDTNAFHFVVLNPMYFLPEEERVNPVYEVEEMEEE
jgi:hypothetical protein